MPQIESEVTTPERVTTEPVSNDEREAAINRGYLALVRTSLDVPVVVPPEQLPLLRKIVDERLDLIALKFPRIKTVLQLRYGLTGEEPKDLEEIGKGFNVTKERARQIKIKGLRKLRHPRESIQLYTLLRKSNDLDSLPRHGSQNSLFQGFETLDRIRELGRY